MESVDPIGRLFKEFEQAGPPVAREHGGSGLSLAMSKQLVERMGGGIGVDSEPGVGSLFWFGLELPSPAEIGPLYPSSILESQTGTGGHGAKR